MAAAVPQLRRHPPARRHESRSRRPGAGAGQRVVPRAAGMDRGTPDLRNRARRPGPAGDRLRDGHRQTVVTDESWRAGPIRRDRQRSLRRPDHRRTTSRHCMAIAGVRRRSVGRRPRAALRRGDPDCVRRTAGPPAAGDRGTTGLAIAHRTHPGRLRAEPGRVGAVRRCRRPWSHHHGPLRRGARRRGAGDAAPAQRAGHRPTHPLRGHGPLRADHDRPRIPIRPDRRLARRAHPCIGDRGGRALRAPADRGVPLLRRPAQPAPRAMSYGRCAGTSWTSRPTARSATNASVGPATSPCSPRRPRSCSMWPDSCATGSPIWPPSSAPPPDGCRSWSPTS